MARDVKIFVHDPKLDADRCAARAHDLDLRHVTFDGRCAEIGPDQFTRTFVRRFSPPGVAQDSEPLEVTRQQPDFTNPSIPSPAITSNGDTYLIVSQGKGRRMSARTGIS